MKIDRASAIKLDVYKDPQAFVLIEHVRDEAWLYFRCLDSAGDYVTYVGCLHFEGVWHLASSRFKKLRGYPDIEETNLLSYYLRVEQSSLITSLQKKRMAHDADWQLYDKLNYQHWVLESHDFYTDIIASRVKFQRITGREASRCFEIWDRV